MAYAIVVEDATRERHIVTIYEDQLCFLGSERRINKGEIKGGFTIVRGCVLLTNVLENEPWFFKKADNGDVW